MLSRMLAGFVGVVVGAAVVGVGVTQGQAPAKVVRAQSFELVDSDGRLHGGFAATKDGPGLILFDGTATVRLMLSVGEDGPALVLHDRAETPRVMLAVSKDGGPILLLYDANAEPRAVLGAHTVETPRFGVVVERNPESCLVLRDQGGRIIWRAP